MSCDAVFRIQIRMDPHQLKGRIRIRVEVEVIRWLRIWLLIRINLQMPSKNGWNMRLFEQDLDPDPHQSDKQDSDPDPHQRDKQDSIRIRIKVMWIRNTNVKVPIGSPDMPFLGNRCR
jgi:hypothetical protein